MKILVVDDEPLMRQVLRVHLERAGHQVLEAENGRVAWSRVQTEHTRMIITDWMMPEMDGAELIRQIRQAALPQYTYIIMLTARDMHADVLAGLKSGADDYMTKPFDHEELLARVAIGGRILELETRLSEALAQMQELATSDSLTGLLNRRAVHAHAESELNRAQRDGGQFSLCLMDIDHFKRVNDQYGHLVGDQALRLVADTLARNKRPYDWAGRWGGEEFLLVLPTAGINEACLVAERIRQAVADSQLSLPDGKTLRLFLSAGISTTSLTNGAYATVDMLLQQADEALYQAKHAGRNLVRVYQSQPER